MKVVFLWTDISGYMGACWRKLSDTPGVKLKVFAYGSSNVTEFSREQMDGVDWQPLDTSQRNDAEFLERQISQFSPDVIVISGWLNPAYRSLTKRPGLRNKRFIMTMDTPWWGKPRQYIARYALNSYLSSIDTVVVTGERSWQYARRLGFEGSQIVKGLYGVNYEELSPLLDGRQQLPEWPKRFLFAGRYTEEKGLDLLISAYQRYRERVDEPWPLVCCGKGDLGRLLKEQKGVVDKGFVQPDALRDEMLHSGAFIMPSRFDPWPLAIVEACAAGLPVICSDACGSAVELVRHGFSGYTFADLNVDALCERLLQVHNTHFDLPKFGERANTFAEPYSAEEWAKRWMNLLG